MDFLLELGRFDADQVWRELGHSHFFNFLRRELGMSKTLAYYRMVGASLLRKYPALEEPLRDGRLCVSSLPQLQKVIREDNWQAMLPRFYGCSKREAQRVVVAIAPVENPPMRDVIVQVSTSLQSVHPVEPTSTPLSNTSMHPSEMAESIPLSPRPVETPRDTLEPLTSQLHRIHFTASEAFIQKLEAVKDTLARDFPEGDLESIFEAGLDALLAKAAKRTAQTEKPRKAPEACNIATPRIADPIRRAVYQRDAHQCQWPLHSGQICGEKRFLELDHIVPLARGGPSSLENLRVLCRAHNQEAARHVFGDAFMQRFRHPAQRSSAGTGWFSVLSAWGD